MLSPFLVFMVAYGVRRKLGKKAARVLYALLIFECLFFNSLHKILRIRYGIITVRLTFDIMSKRTEVSIAPFTSEYAAVIISSDILPEVSYATP